MAADQQDYMPGFLAQLQQAPIPARRELLNRAVEQHPRDPRPLLLLAAEEMRAERVDRAEAAFMFALQLAPDFAIARFQLGLLQFTSARPAAATATWAPLEALPDGEPLKTFKRGLEALTRDQYEEARDLLLAGIAANQENEPLNRDMQLVITRMREMGLLRDGPAEAGAGQPVPPDAGQEHFLVTGYGRKV